MKKPTMKQEVKVTDALGGSVRTIYFYSTADAVSEFESFGLLEKWADKTDYYQLEVDARFDFDEVVRFMNAYG